MEKQIFLIISSLMFLFFGNNLSALINGGFETGNFNGWTTTIPDLGSADVVTSFTSGSTPTGQYGPLAPQSGNYFAQIEAGLTDTPTKIEQVINLSGAGLLDGYATWFDAELATNQPVQYNDMASVKVYLNNVLVATPWSVQHAGNTTVLPPWTYWSYSATQAGTYTLEYSVVNTTDSFFSSYAFFDSTSFTPFTPVPEPSTYALLATGLLFASFVYRAKMKRKINC